eukprot:gene17223-biopygen8916
MNPIWLGTLFRVQNLARRFGFRISDVTPPAEGGAHPLRNAGSLQHDPATEARLDEWVKAKRAKDYATADAICAALRAKGVQAEVARPPEAEVARPPGAGKRAWETRPLVADKAAARRRGPPSHQTVRRHSWRQLCHWRHSLAARRHGGTAWRHGGTAAQLGSTAARPGGRAAQLCGMASTSIIAAALVSRRYSGGIVAAQWRHAIAECFQGMYMADHGGMEGEGGMVDPGCRNPHPSVEASENEQSWTAARPPSPPSSPL